MNTLKLLLIGLFAMLESLYITIVTALNRRGLVVFLNLYSQRVYDASLLLKAAALVASSANGSLILDVGNGLLDCDMVIDVTALEIDSNDESYTVVLEGSPDAAFGTAGNIMPLAKITIGTAASTAGVLQAQGADDVVGRYLVPVRNERNGTTYRYLRVRTVIAGTIATGINYSAWLAMDD